MVDQDNKKLDPDIDGIDPVQANLLTPKWLDRWKESLAFAFAAVLAYDFIIAPIIVQVADASFKATLPGWSHNTFQGGKRSM